MRTSTLIIIVIVVIVIITVVTSLLVYYLKKRNMAPKLPTTQNNFSVKKQFNSTLTSFQWILSWTPSTGTAPITYYYNITTADNKPFLNGSTQNTNIILTGAQNNTTYNASLYAQNAYGKSNTVTQKIITAGPR